MTEKEMIENLITKYEHSVQNTNKLVQYIAVQEGKDYEDIVKEFELWEDEK